MLKQNSSQVSDLKDKFVEAVLERDGYKASNVIDSALELGLSAGDIYVNILSESQVCIGKMYHEGKVSTALEHFATETALGQMIKVSNAFPVNKRNGYRAVVACVEGNMHSFGARIVADFMRLDGWEVEFLGSDTLTSDLIQFITDGDINLLALSVSLDDQIPHVESVMKSFAEMPDPPMLMLGGGCPSIKTLDKHTCFRSDTVKIIVGSDPIEAMIGARVVCGITDTDGRLASLEDYLIVIGDQIQKLRKGKSWSQATLAASCGLDRTYISAVEHGKQNLTIGAAVKLADALDTSLVHLLSHS